MSDTDRNPLLEGWHIDKRLSLGHIVTTLVVGVTALLWLANIDKRVDLNDQKILAITEQQMLSDARQVRALQEVKDEIRTGIAALRADVRAMTGRIDRSSDKHPRNNGE